MTYLLGIDIGSTTIKLALLDAEDGRVLETRYRRHHTDQRRTLYAMLEPLAQEFGDLLGHTRAFITGSAGQTFAPQVNAPFIQEVNAVVAMAEVRYPSCGAVVDIGGQDSKVVLFGARGTRGFRRRFTYMNDKCAGGTGAVIDRIASKLGTTPADIGTFDFDADTLHEVASKCGIFAESDINFLQKQGVPIPEIVNSLFDAVVRQNLGTLTRGNTPQPPVLLIGGPNHFFRSLRQAWTYELQKLWNEEEVEYDRSAVTLPADALFFPAMGAALYGARQEGPGRTLDTLRSLEIFLTDGLEEMKRASGVPAVACRGLDMDQFYSRFAPRRAVERAPGTADGGIFVGLDAGSTSVKACAIDGEGALLASSYRMSEDLPIEDAAAVLGDLVAQLDGTTSPRVLRLAVTGYAKDLLYRVLQADLAIVETVAHLEAARRFFPTTDVIVDVGGQDIKILLANDDVVTDFRLNNQCSAGNGYYLQSTAQRFDIPLERYAERAFGARTMPRFRGSCGVFLESDIVHYQRLGWSADEILAGLAAVLPVNIWEYVAQVHNLSELGHSFVLQGGTQRNLAALKAQVDYILERIPDAEVHVHPFCGETGALGAALCAREDYDGSGESRFVGVERLSRLDYDIRRGADTICPSCANRCIRTFITVREEGASPSTHIIASCVAGETPEGRRGNQRAGRGSVDHALDLVARHNRLTFAVPRDLERFGSSPGIRIGLPRVLNMYRLAPLFTAYLVGIGFEPGEIVLSGPTTEAQWKAASNRNSADLCFPGKYGVGHVVELIHRKRVDAIFNPCIITLEDDLERTLGSFACVVTSSNPEIMRASLTKGRSLLDPPRYYSPTLHAGDPDVLSYELRRFSRRAFGVSRRTHRRALAQARQYQRSVLDRLQREGTALLEDLDQQGRRGILFLAKPYHGDPGINLKIPQRLTRLGYPVLPTSCLPRRGALLENLFAGDAATPMDISDVWKYSASVNSNDKVWAARFAARCPALAVVDFVSFRCGHDATIAKVVERILRDAGTPYFAFHDMDQSNPHGAIKLRLETLDHALRRL